MDSGVSITWSPGPLLGPFRPRRDRPLLNNKLNAIMLAMAREAHTAGGIPPWKLSARVKKYGGVTGTFTGKLRRGWRPTPGKAEITNPVAYAGDFYYGHARRLVHVPAHTRRTRKGKVNVRAHYKYEAAQAARPINWTRPWTETALAAVADHYELR